MPRVSDDHLAARRRQVLDAALRCFERDGFHATSVRDVVRESGLSAGAVYSYFPSKDALVVAVVEPIIQTVTGVLDGVLADGRRSPAEVVQGVLLGVWPIAVGGGANYTRVAVTAWGEALRDATVHGIATRTYGMVRRRLGERVAHWRDAGHLPPDTDAEALGQALFSLLVGAVLQHALLGDLDPERYAAAVGRLLPPG
ncbi:AcrR family transcriptional regulator [Geodermatophilus bullaregiensis]|uniref:TetR/AcrR family transcriptional regulator n=1 Tax=Geodermatophilus bullaregiensis TaxID=1564160 RepID=UPI00195EC328|nr:TetR/AcrR family transcriptional regulator [Geodermatophilus bullaregiensis]MBM7805402.1 AcrR family transcriptional regulator [Geodermatophilus bullaregiensis]